jgi:hypothetical protein
MTTFPALQPQTRTYTPGQHPSTPLPVLSGNEISVRHTNGATGNTLRLTFAPITRADQFAIISHYNIHGRFIAFDLATETLVASNITVQTNYQWIYASSPAIDETCATINVTVELELVPPAAV